MKTQQQETSFSSMQNAPTMTVMFIARPTTEQTIQLFIMVKNFICIFKSLKNDYSVIEIESV
jgi:hypothetical protein